MKIELNDRIDGIVTEASRALSDEVFEQNGLENPTLLNVDDGADDSYYGLQEKLRAAIIDAAIKVINEEEL